MEVLKKNGNKEKFKREKLVARLKVLEGRSPYKKENVDYKSVVEKVASGLMDETNSDDIDTLLAETSAMAVSKNPDYSYLASAIEVSKLHKETHDTFSKKMEILHYKGFLNEEFFEYVQENAEYLDSIVDYKRDYEIDYFGFKTLKRAYLLRDDNDIIVERPADLYLRVAVSLRMGNLEDIRKVYGNIGKYYVHATPTLFNAGTKKQQLASCFLLDTEDSIDGIFKTLTDCAKISQSAGGIGINFNKVGATGRKIKGTSGQSSGIVPFLKIFNETARAVDQNGKRKGSIAVYMSPWHGDIFKFLDLRKNHGKEEMRARDLFLALWVSDLFMERVRENGKWTLFCPNTTPLLNETYGQRFRNLYEKYENDGLGLETVSARKLWEKILESQMETGTPYILYKDASNIKNNQNNLGTIKNSNLCMTADQRVVTDKGYLTVKELHEMDEELNLFDGEKMVKSSKMKLRGKQEDVYKITLKNGLEHKVTGYHGLSVLDKYNKPRRVDCKDLKIGDRVEIQINKGLFGKKNVILFNYLDYGINIPNCIWDSNEETQLLYIRYILDKITNIKEDGKNEYIVGYHTFAKDLQLLLINNGYSTKLKRVNEKTILKISSTTKKTSKVVKIEYIGKEDVYCPTVYNNENIFIAQGFKTYNCGEILQFSSKDEVAVCNLASISVKDFYDTKTKKYDFHKLKEISAEICININKVIDISFYPVPEAKKSNLRHRPMGIGIQGLADLFAIMKINFDSNEAKEINKKIFASIYFGALESSCDLAKEFGVYESYEGSPMSQGKLQFDLWNAEPHEMWDWEYLRSKIRKYGIRNSMLLAPMPTASTSQILSNNECFEPFTTNIFTRRTLSGEFIVVNKYLINDLMEIGMWNSKIRNKLIKDNGSIQNIDGIPQNIKDRYKTVWEISQKSIIDMAADRGIYICQTQSMNLFMSEPKLGAMSSMHFYAWGKGLKTGMYYLRSKPAVNAIKFTVEKEEVENNAEAQLACSIDNPDDCMMCGS